MNNIINKIAITTIFIFAIYTQHSYATDSLSCQDEPTPTPTQQSEPPQTQTPDSSNTTTTSTTTTNTGNTSSSTSWWSAWMSQPAIDCVIHH